MQQNLPSSSDVVSSTMNDEREEESPDGHRQKKGSSVFAAAASSSTCDLDMMTDLKEEPDFVETNCHWSGCAREFETQDQLVKVGIPEKSLVWGKFVSARLCISRIKICGFFCVELIFYSL